MIKILFLIHDLGPGGAEKVLVNLVNNMNPEKYDITLMALFDVGINKKYIRSHVNYRYCFRKMIRGNSHLLKLFSPSLLHKLLIKEKYDIEVAYLEGPCARIISGCPNSDTKLFAWIHIEQHTQECAASSFRSIQEAETCYNRFDAINCVSKSVLDDFRNCLHIQVPLNVVYNTNETNEIIRRSKEIPDGIVFSPEKIKLIGIGKLLKNKGYDRLLRIVDRLNQAGYPIHLYLLGVGKEEENLKKFVSMNHLEETVTFLGYQTNPYQYLEKCDLFVCASFREGFSTAATEALILGIPVCTVEVSGMKEMLGENNEYGVVTENNEESLYQGIKCLFDNPELLAHYKKQAEMRGKLFSTRNTVKAVEEMMLSV